MTGSVSPDLMFYLSLPQSSFSIPISVTVILLGSIVTVTSNQVNRARVAASTLPSAGVQVPLLSFGVIATQVSPVHQF